MSDTDKPNDDDDQVEREKKRPPRDRQKRGPGHDRQVQSPGRDR